MPEFGTDNGGAVSVQLQLDGCPIAACNNARMALHIIGPCACALATRVMPNAWQLTYGSELNGYSTRHHCGCNKLMCVWLLRTGFLEKTARPDRQQLRPTAHFIQYQRN